MRTKEIETIENIRAKLRTRLDDKEGEWKTIKGTHVLIDPNGQITKGPERLRNLRSGDNKERIRKLEEELSHTSRFGESGKRRAEILKELNDLRGQAKEPEKKAERKPPETNAAPATEKKSLPVTDKKREQFDIIQKTNPMRDNVHTGIRSAEEIKSAEEAFKTAITDDDFIYPDFTKEDAERALESGKITVYSSKPIKQGGFVSPSKRMAQDYAGSGDVYSMEVPVNDVAWIDSSEGQFTGKPEARLRDELQPQVPDADFSLEDDEEDFVRKNAGNSRRPTGVYNLYNSIKGSGGEAMLAVEDEYYKHRLNACTKDLKEITRKEADEILYDNLRQSTVEGWFRAYDHNYKPGLVWQMTRSPEVHNAALNVMYDNYKWYCKDRNLEAPSYEEFLVTPIKMYRGGTGKEYKKAAVFSSYTFDKKVAESFTGSQVGMGHAYDPNGVVYEAEIRPIDTYGSVFHNGESEILVPRVIAPNKNRDEAG